MRLPGLIYDSPYTFSFKQRLMLRLLPAPIALTMRLLYASNRIETRGMDHFEKALARHGHVILALWHETMALGGCQFAGRNFHTLTSYSFDGEMAARIIRCYEEEAVRGSSSRGGHAALQQLEKALKLVPCVGFTLDGPRGPRRLAKPGIAILAGRTATPVLPLAFALRKSWRLRSWDRFPIPKPFGKIICAIGEPIPPPPDDSPEAVEKARLEIETRLNKLHQSIELEIGDIQAIE